MARASTTLNILQQTGASIGTAVLSVILASALTSQLGGHGHATIGAAAALPPSVREKIAPPMAAAFGQTFWWALALIVVAFIGLLALPRQKPKLTGDQASPGAGAGRLSGARASV